MKKVELKIKKGNTVETIQHTIEPISLIQFRDGLKIIKDIIEQLRKDDLLSPLLQGIEGVEGGPGEDQELMAFLAGAFEMLLIEIPDHALHLLATLSGVKHDDLLQQKVEDAFDIYDAVIEVNDLEKLIARGKKSLTVTKARTKFLQRNRTATAAASAAK
jgi:hypothetical protein